MHQIRLGAFELYPSERRLCAAGKPVDLGARAFDLLLVLVEHHGRLVSKNTLIERVWPRVIVDENNLPAQIASLRRVLGAGAIRTVPGFGYRLELEVSTEQVASATGSSSADEVLLASRSAPLAPPGSPAAPAAPSHSPRLSVPRHTWPYRLGPLIGRQRELQELRLKASRSALITIVGAAGVGKTRLAQELLAREAQLSENAVAWVSVGALADIQHVPSAIARALGQALPDGPDGFAALGQMLQGVPLLLILDCAERLRDALSVPLAGMISQIQGVRALVTSQVPLGIAGEVVYRLAPLAVPDHETPAAEAARYDAVALFVERASSADRCFELTSGNTRLVTEICRRLDGNPLALELAAARIPALGLSALLERLDDRFRLLKLSGGSLEPRHNALLTAFEWSYSLLSSVEQRVFNRLGAFAGSFSLKAAARCVADDSIDTLDAIDLVGRLVDRSLVSVLAEEPPRYLLLETARHYALQKLQANAELGAAQERMATAMLDVLDVAYEEYWSVDEAIWLHRYEPELANVRAAIDWATERDHGLGVALFGSAWPLFVEADLYPEGRSRYAQVLGALSDSLPRLRVGRFWEAIAAYDSTRQCDRARFAAELAARMYSEARDARSHYHALLQLAFNWRADTAAARAAFDAARRMEDPAWPARLLSHGALTEGALLTSAGQYIEARTAYQRAMKFALTASERQALAATVNIVELDIACGDTNAALQLGRPLAMSLRHVGRRETRFELLVLIFSALLLVRQTDEARTTGLELYELGMRLDPGKLFAALDAMALLMCLERRYDAAARVATYADAAHKAHGQLHRRPAEYRIWILVRATLDEQLGTRWLSCGQGYPEQLNEASACRLALGLPG